MTRTAILSNLNPTPREVLDTDPAEPDIKHYTTVPTPRAGIQGVKITVRGKLAAQDCVNIFFYSCDTTAVPNQAALDAFLRAWHVGVAGAWAPCTANKYSQPSIFAELVSPKPLQALQSEIFTTMVGTAPGTEAPNQVCVNITRYFHTLAGVRRHGSSKIGGLVNGDLSGSILSVAAKPKFTTLETALANPFGQANPLPAPFTASTFAVGSYLPASKDYNVIPIFAYQLGVYLGTWRRRKIGVGS